LEDTPSNGLIWDVAVTPFLSSSFFLFFFWKSEVDFLLLSAMASQSISLSFNDGCEYHYC